MKKTVFTLLLFSLSLSVMAQEAWMAKLDDRRLITSLLIPGTHDTGTGNGFTPEFQQYAETIATTQDCSLTEQLASGIRAFDLRPAMTEENGKKHLHIFHGPMKTNLSYEDAIHELIAFVKAHPTEFAIVVQRHEHEGSADNKEWEEAMCRFLNSNGVKENIVNYSPTLTVGDMRGRIIVLSRVHYSDTPVGGYIEHWTSSEDFSEQTGAEVWGSNGRNKLCVQDYYETIGEHMNIKLQNMKRMLDYSAENHDALIINHCSAYSEEIIINGYDAATSNGYRDNAVHTNTAMGKWIKKKKGARGLIMMDYAGTNKSKQYKVNGLRLTKAVIKAN